MTDPNALSPAEAAAANAIDAENAQHANADLAGDDTLTEQQLADRAHALEAKLAAIQARKAAGGQAIPHTPAKPAAAPVVPAGTSEQVKVAPMQMVNGVVVSQNNEPVVSKSVAPSARLAEILASGVKPVKKQYKYKRNR